MKIRRHNLLKSEVMFILTHQEINIIIIPGENSTMSLIWNGLTFLYKLQSVITWKCEISDSELNG